MSERTVDCTVQYVLADIHDFYLNFYLWGRYRHALMFVLAVAIILGLVLHLPVLVSVCALFGLFAFAGVWIWVPRAAQRTLVTPAFSAKQEVQMNEKGLCLNSETMQSEIKWNNFANAIESRTSFVLFQSPYSFVVLPKRCFSDSNLRTARELIRDHVPEQVPDLRLRFSMVLGLLLFIIVAILAGMYSGLKPVSVLGTGGAALNSTVAPPSTVEPPGAAPLRGTTPPLGTGSPLTGEPQSVRTEESSVTFVPRFSQRITELGEQIQLVQGKSLITAQDSSAFLERQKKLVVQEDTLSKNAFPKADMEQLDRDITALNADLFSAMGKGDPVKLAEVLPLQAWELEQSGKFAQAQEAWSKLLRLQEKSGASATDLARTKSAMALPILEEGNIDQAEPLLLDAEKTLLAAPDHESKGLAHVYYGLAKISIARGDYKKAAQTLQQAIDRRTRAAGASDPELVQLWQELAEVDLVQGKLKESQAALDRMLRLADEKYGKDSAQAADAFKDLGTICFKRGELGKANSFFNKSLAIKSASFGVDSVSSAEVMVCLAMLYTKERRYKQAERLFQRALEIRTRELGVDSPQAIRTKELYGTLQKLMGGK